MLLRAERYAFVLQKVTFWTSTSIISHIAKVQQYFETIKYLLYFLHYECKIIYIILIIRRLHNSRRGAKYVISSILYDNSCYEIKVRGVYTASIVDLKVVKKNLITGIT